jgi:hypothetical protein
MQEVEPPGLAGSTVYVPLTVLAHGDGQHALHLRELHASTSFVNSWTKGGLPIALEIDSALDPGCGSPQLPP